MASNSYHLVSNWRILGDIDEVFDLISDTQALSRWWPAAFLEVLELEPAGEEGLGAVVRLETRGWMPYKLHWHLRVDDYERPQRLGFEVWGDFEGRGLWQLTQNGAWVDVSFDWQIAVQKPLVRQLSFLVKPLFTSNHRWAMAKGEESLRLTLARQHAASDDDREALPQPPGQFAYPKALLAGLGALFALLLLRRRHKPPPIED